MKLYEIEIEQDDGQVFTLNKSFTTEALTRFFLDYFNSSLYKSVKIRCFEADDDQILFEYGKLLKTQNPNLFIETQNPIIIK